VVPAALLLRKALDHLVVEVHHHEVTDRSVPHPGHASISASLPAGLLAPCQPLGNLSLSVPQHQNKKNKSLSGRTKVSPAMRHAGLELSLFGSKTRVAAPSFCRLSGGSIQQHLHVLLPQSSRCCSQVGPPLSQHLQLHAAPALHLGVGGVGGCCCTLQGSCPSPSPGHLGGSGGHCAPVLGVFSPLSVSSWEEFDLHSPIRSSGLSHPDI